MPIQIANSGGGFTSSAIIDGVLYAINNGADVINLSIHMKYGEDKGAENTGDENRKKFKRKTIYPFRYIIIFKTFWYW